MLIQNWHDVSENPAAPEREPAADLLPGLYDELRGLAAALTRKLAPGQTLQPTALVHEAYLRLVGTTDPGWEGRRHFFGSASRAMRQILVEQARRRAAIKHGGAGQRMDLIDDLAVIEPPADDLLALDDAIQQLHHYDPKLAEIVNLRYFAGLSVDEVAEVIGSSPRTVFRDWRYAKAWLAKKLGASSEVADA